MSLLHAGNFLGDRLRGVPIAIVYVTERCPSRCTACDFWRNGIEELSVGRARTLAAELSRLGTSSVLLTGGEVLFHPEWVEVARAFRERGMTLWLLTAGLSLEQRADEVGELCEKVTVSIDGATRESYREIRGVDALDAVSRGVGRLVSSGVWVSIRVTVQRRNYRELRELVRLARRLRVREISFLAADVRSAVAFARPSRGGAALAEATALAPNDLPRFDEVLDVLEREHAADFQSGFIAESPGKLRRLRTYFAALLGQEEFPPTRCNAPRFSLVVRANGALQPCHFIEGTAARETIHVNDPGLVAIRRGIRLGRNETCRGCVCPSWKSPLDVARGRLFGS